LDKDNRLTGAAGAWHWQAVDKASSLHFGTFTGLPNGSSPAGFV
jgi:hypothetical protein